MKGYKQTKIGLIPKDWEVVRLGDITVRKPKYGINAPAIKYSYELPTYIRITDIDDNGNFNKSKRVSVDYENWEEFLLEESDILFARTGATVGKSYLYKKEDGKLVYAGYLIKFSINKELILPQFLKYWVNTNYYWYWVKKMSVRSGQPGINAEEYKKLLIPLPPLKEQEKIAKILSTWDEAIESQEKLIKEKEKFKKALMQRLLKIDDKKREPKVRFKEFSGEWVDVDLEGLVNSRDILLGRGEVISKKDIENIKGNYPIYSSSTKNNGLFGYYGKYMFDEELITWSIDGGGDFFYRPKHKFSITNVSGFIKVLKKGKINTYFLALILQYKKQFLHFDYQSKAHPGVIKKLYKFYIPPTLKEQEKIADVLSTIDKEIDLLKLELNELKKQKKALMQKLLTGKVRVEV